MADGTLRPIERVFKGDLVLATDPKTGATVARRVTALIRSDGLKDLAVVWAAGQRLIATDEHPFYTAERGWVAAADLRRGEHLSTLTASRSRRRRARPRAYTWVYNLTVEGLHTYYAGADPVLVHNARNKKRGGNGSTSSCADWGDVGRTGSRHIPESVKEEEAILSQGRCRIASARCRTSPAGTSREWDHGWPHSQGGDATIDNIQSLCRDCNRQKRPKSTAEYISGSSSDR